MSIYLIYIYEKWISFACLQLFKKGLIEVPQSTYQRGNGQNTKRSKSNNNDNDFYSYDCFHKHIRKVPQMVEPLNEVDNNKCK